MIDRKELYEAIDRLPDEAMSEVARFIEFLEFRVNREQQETAVSPPDTHYNPVNLPAKIIAEVDFTPDYIAAARKELWANFGEAHS